MVWEVGWGVGRFLGWANKMLPFPLRLVLCDRSNATLVVSFLSLHLRQSYRTLDYILQSILSFPVWKNRNAACRSGRIRNITVWILFTRL